MAELTKQDIQNIVQQNTNTVLSKNASRQDVHEAMQYLTQRLCSKQDMQAFIDRAKERSAERFGASMQDQQSCVKQMLINTELLAKRLDRIESRIVDLQTSMQLVKATNNMIASHTRLNQFPLRGETTSDMPVEQRM